MGMGMNFMGMWGDGVKADGDDMMVMGRLPLPCHTFNLNWTETICFNHSAQPSYTLPVYRDPWLKPTQPLIVDTVLTWWGAVAWWCAVVINQKVSVRYRIGSVKRVETDYVKALDDKSIQETDAGTETHSHKHTQAGTQTNRETYRETEHGRSLKLKCKHTLSYYKLKQKHAESANLRRGSL